MALVGFSGKITEEATSDLSARLQSFKDQEFGPNLYKVMTTQLGKGFKWQFIPMSKVTADAAYRSLSQTKSMQAYSGLSRFEMAIVVKDLIPGLLAAGMLGIVKTRAKIMKELNVDTLLVADFQVHASATKAPTGPLALLKAANSANAVDVMLYKCRLALYLYNGVSDDAIWEKHGFSGETADSPTVKVFGISFPDKRQAAVVSSYTNALKEAVEEVKSELQ